MHKARSQNQAKETEIIALAKGIKKYLSETSDSFPDEALNMVMHVSHTVDRARNRFSDAISRKKRQVGWPSTCATSTIPKFVYYSTSSEHT